jgi:hypothetical protein
MNGLPFIPASTCVPVSQGAWHFLSKLKEKKAQLDNSINGLFAYIGLNSFNVRKKVAGLWWADL